MNCRSLYQEFCAILDDALRGVTDKNIIIYGANAGGEFIKWYCGYRFHRSVKFIMDRWATSPVGTVPHLYTLYYCYDKDDVIINVTPKKIEEEFCEIGEDWSKVKYTDSQILNLWESLYGDTSAGEETQVTFYDWLEVNCGIDLLHTVRRKLVDGEGAHGYYPTDFCVFADALRDIALKDGDAVLDIGCGKGAAIIAFSALGFRSVGGVEYTRALYETLSDNLEKLGVPHARSTVRGRSEFNIQGGVLLSIWETPRSSRRTWTAIIISSCSIRFPGK